MQPAGELQVKTQQNFFLEPTGRLVAGASASMAKPLGLPKGIFHACDENFMWFYMV
jgi:hypothetical protein